MIKNKFSVLHWAPQSGTETGSGKAIDAWTEAAAASGALVRVISQNRAPEVGRAGEVSYFGGPLTRRELFRILSNQLRTVDVVHLHGGFDPTLSLVLALVGIEKLRRSIHGQRLSAILTPHGALADYVFQKNHTRKVLYWHLLDRWLMLLIDKFVCNSPIELDQLKRRLPRASGTTVPLIVKPDVTTEDSESIHLAEPQSIPLLCTVGRYDIGIKGLDLLIAAVLRLNHEGLPIRLRCIGYDRQGGTAELERFVESKNAIAFVDCTGPKFGFEKDALLKESTVFCMPSRYESFSYSLMEGLGSGLPVLVGEGACVTSYLSSDQRDLLVVEPSIGGWVTAIRRVIGSPEANRYCAERVFRFFNEMCTPDAVGSSLCRVYATLI